MSFISWIPKTLLKQRQWMWTNAYETACEEAKIKISCWENAIWMVWFCIYWRGQQCGFEVSLLVSVDLSGLEHLPSTGLGMFPTGVVEITLVPGMHMETITMFKVGRQGMRRNSWKCWHVNTNFLQNVTVNSGLLRVGLWMLKQFSKCSRNSKLLWPLVFFFLTPTQKK